MQKDRVTTVRLPMDLYLKVEAYSKEQDLTISQVLRRASKQWISDQDKKRSKEFKQLELGQ